MEGRIYASAQQGIGRTEHIAARKGQTHRDHQLRANSFRLQATGVTAGS